MKSAEIRQKFFDFFESKGHKIVPSAPMVIKNDPTLMFTNAGMNQFKEYFLGNSKAEYRRIADTQKCLRVSGKHNDLDEVGLDTYHHTMFEMLGNWSFGDYFKIEAIDWAWELLAGVYGIDKSRLYATYFGGDKSENLEPDKEALDLWRKYLPETRIIAGSKKDNFWEMGDTGPCGPCSEIHADLRDEEERIKIPGEQLVNTGHPLVIEIWNLVFIQFNRLNSGQLEALPERHVDTGMGFERLSMVLQGVKSNYDTDVFQPLIQEAARIAGKKYGENEKVDIALRVIADHLRAVSFSIADGQLPSNNKAGYVIRRILRRAVRYAYTYLDVKEPFIYKLVDKLIFTLGIQFNEIIIQLPLITAVIKEEESSFFKTLKRGINRFKEVVSDRILTYYFSESENRIIERRAFDFEDYFSFDLLFKNQNVGVFLFSNEINKISEVEEKIVVLSIDGLKELNRILKLNEEFDKDLITIIDSKTAFELYDTFGFPIDLTLLMAKEINWTVDVLGFNELMEKQKERSRSAATLETSDWQVLSEKISTEFIGYDYLEADVKILRFRKINTKGKELFQLVFDQTPFYAESGGQVGDSGFIEADGIKIEISDTLKENNQILHISSSLPIDPTSTFRAVVSLSKRRDIMKNHTATHLLHQALRSVLGTHVEQKGSLVDNERLRFDFSHFQKVSEDDIEKIEFFVNEKVMANYPLQENRSSGMQEAVELGAIALFGEKYGEVVRTIKFGDSIELCGGTHAHATGEIGLFKIVAESAIAAGIRRIEAITGVKAFELVQSNEKLLVELSLLLNSNIQGLPKAAQNLVNENKVFQKELEAYKMEKIISLRKEMILNAEKVGNMHLICQEVVLDSPDSGKDLVFEINKNLENSISLIAARFAEKVNLWLMISTNLVEGKNLNAVEIIKTIGKEIQGGGGGQPFFATAGGKKPEGIENALTAGRAIILSKIQ